MIFTPCSKQVDLEPFKGLIMDSLTKTPLLRDRASKELRCLEDAVLNDTLMVVVISDPDPIGIITMELFPDVLHVRNLTMYADGWMDEVMDMLIWVARSRGKSIIRGGGRKGWTKVLKRLGFEPKGKFMQVTL